MKIKLYIDFDGVILNTIDVSYKKIKEIYGENATTEEAQKYYQNIDWDSFLKECSPINNSVNILELTSLSNVKNFSNWVHVEKLMPTPNKDMNSLNLKKKTLVPDLDETLVHSSTQCPFPNKKNISFKQ